MTSTEILARITARTGQNTPSEMLYAELNIAIRDLWDQTDPAGSIQEVFVRSGNTEYVLTLPPYVFQVKGVRHSFGLKPTLYTPRPYYDDLPTTQGYLTWRELGHSAVFQSLSGIGQLRLRTTGPNGAAFRVIVQGPDAQSNHQRIAIDFGASDIEKVTPKAFADIIEIGKTALTDVNIDVYDVNDKLVSTILAREQRADCIVIRITDAAIAATAWPNTVYQILYKTRPPVVQVDELVSFHDSVGRTLTDLVSSEILGRSKDAADQGRSRAYEKRAARRVNEQTIMEADGKQIPLKLTTSPHYHLYPGTL